MLNGNATDELIIFQSALYSLENNQGTLIDHVNFVMDTCRDVHVGSAKYHCSHEDCQNTIYDGGLCRVHWFKSEKKRLRGFKMHDGDAV